MPGLDISAVIGAPPQRVLKAFFEPEALHAWWQVRHAVTAPRVLGPYAVAWETTEFRDGTLTRMLNLSDAIARWRSDPSGQREWRTHFHVPIFLDDLGGFRTTRSSIREALRVHAKTPLSDHLEIETYTWDVLPPDLKRDLTDSIAREYAWVLNALGQQGVP